MKTLVLITSQFPFGKGEPFLETELPFISAIFDRKIIIAQNTRLDRTRQLPADFKVFRYNTATSFAGFLAMPLLVIDNLSYVVRIIHGELHLRNRRQTPLSFRQRAFLIKKIIKALQLKRFISRILKREGITDNILFYSYWLNSGAHAISLLNYNHSIRVARAHRYDLIEEDSRLSYLPMLSLCSSRLDAIFFVSEKGMTYFIQKAGTSRAELILSQLGVPGHVPAIPSEEESDTFTIVSCSNILPFKRIDLIIKALAAVNTEKKIHWIHFGDGPLRGEMERLAEEMLGSVKNVSYSFMGHYPNSELIDYYSSHKIDLFLNTSSIEGIPVSIMEAQSFASRLLQQMQEPFPR